jgi:uncharacterized protein (DUF362 family)
MAPDPAPSGVIVAGVHPVAVDCAAAALMGFDWRKIALLKNSFGMRHLNFAQFSPNAVRVVSDKAEWAGSLDQMDEAFGFRPHFGWVGAIQRDRAALSA